ncbi:MAG: SusF/SusE family outer membrane protein [Pedobacter sp.]|nr:MAG: SusF/SusE family outer membrane protein [Pedobacter sp.]
MKNKLFYLLLSLSVIVFGCKKTEFDEVSRGEALGAFTLSAPENNAILVLNSATPNAPIQISWAAAKPGVSTAPTYTFVAALKTGSLEQPLLEVPSNENGKSNKLTLTQKQLDDLLKAKNIAEGVKTDLIWNVRADNGTKKELAGANYNISITRFGDGISNFLLYGPLSSSSSIEINPNSNSDLITFKWQKAFPGKATSGVTYKIKFVGNGGSFDAPIYEVASNNAGSDSTFTISYQALDQLLTSKGFADQSSPARLQWTVVASSGTYTKNSDYVNDLSIVREVKLFMVGGATPIGWNPDKALQMIPDKNLAGTFYAYVYLTQDGMKFLSENTSWDSPSQKIYGKGASDGELIQSGGSGNIDIPVAGYYRVSADLKNNKYYIQQGRMAAVGAATAAGWNPGAVFPSQGLSLIATNKFMGIVSLTAGEQWKFIDGNAWGDGTASGSKDFGKVKNTTDGSITQGDADNMMVPGATGLYRLIWDGSNIKNIKYQITTGTVYLIGAATAGGWDNANAALPAMAYQGNGVWKVTANLTAGEFKFLLQKGTWDYTYGLGTTAGSIVDGGGNMSVTTSGSYTVTLNEFNRTYSVVKN